MADKNKVRFGLSNLAIAKLTPPTTPGGVPTWGTPLKWPGARSITLDVEEEESVFWADNIRYWGTFMDNGYSGEMEVARILDQIATILYGWEFDDLGGLMEISNGQKSNVALLGQFEGDAVAGRWVIYNCAFGKPSSEPSTTEDTIEPTVATMSYTATPTNVGLPGNRLVTKYQLDDDPENAEVHAAYENWYTAVPLPVLSSMGG